MFCFFNALIFYSRLPVDVHELPEFNRVERAVAEAKRSLAPKTAPPSVGQATGNSSGLSSGPRKRRTATTSAASPSQPQDFLDDVRSSIGLMSHSPDGNGFDSHGPQLTCERFV